MMARIKDWKTSGAGLAISGAFWYVFQSFGCQLPSDWLTYAVVALPAVLGLLSHSSRVAPK